MFAHPWKEKMLRSCFWEKNKTVEFWFPKSFYAVLWLRLWCSAVPRVCVLILVDWKDGSANSVMYLIILHTQTVNNWTYAVLAKVKRSSYVRPICSFEISAHRPSLGAFWRRSSPFSPWLGGFWLRKALRTKPQAFSPPINPSSTTHLVMMTGSQRNAVWPSTRRKGPEVVWAVSTVGKAHRCWNFVCAHFVLGDKQKNKNICVGHSGCWSVTDWRSILNRV